MAEQPALREGQWARAPLVFVIAQVRYTKQADGFSEKLCQLIGQLEPENFLPPQAQPLIHVSVEISPTGMSEQKNSNAGIAYSLIRKDGMLTVRAAPDTLSLVVTTYENSTHFRSMWTPMLGCLDEAGLVGPITRIGMRFVNFVIPPEGGTPESFVKSPWSLENFPHLPGAKPKPDMHVSVNDLEFEKGRLRMQYMRGYGEPGLPADLQGLLTPERKTVAPETATAIIDSDRWIDGTFQPQKEILDGYFKDMHTDLNNVFRSMITTQAVEVWGGTMEVNSK